MISDNLVNTKKVTLVKVNNVLDTLERMAKNARMRSKAKFIAVTGSVARLEQRYDAFSFIKSGTYSNESSYNNCRSPFIIARCLQI